MAVGMHMFGAANELIARDPKAALRLTEEILAGGAVTLGAIATSLGVKRHLNQTQLLEVELLDEDAPEGFFFRATHSIRDALTGRRDDVPIKAAWHAGHFNVRRPSHLVNGTDVTHVTTPVLVGTSLIEDPMAIKTALAEMRPMPHL